MADTYLDKSNDECFGKIVAIQKVVTRRERQLLLGKGDDDEFIKGYYQPIIEEQEYMMPAEIQLVRKIFG